MNTYINRDKALAFMLSALVCFSISSCSSDDDEEISQNGSDTAGQVTGSDGEKMLITQVGNTFYSYDSEGKLTAINTSYDGTYTVTYSPFKMVREVNGSSYSEKETVYDIAVNGKGAITSLKAEYVSYSYDEIDEQSSTSYSLSYDGAGHLTGISGSTSGYYYDDGEKYSGKANGSYKLTWSNNKLTKLVCTTNEDGEVMKEEVTFEYGDDLYPNLSHQFTNSLWGSAVEDIDVFSNIGLFGIGGDYLPIKAVCITTYTEDGETESETDTYNYSYTFNSNGTVASETYNGYNTERYSYSSLNNIASASAKALSRSMAQSVGKQFLLNYMFKRLKAHRTTSK